MANRSDALISAVSADKPLATIANYEPGKDEPATDPRGGGVEHPFLNIEELLTAKGEQITTLERQLADQQRELDELEEEICTHRVESADARRVADEAEQQLAEFRATIHRLETAELAALAQLDEAEAENAKLRKLAVEYMEAEKAYRLAHDRGEAGPGLTIRANKADAALRAALEAPEAARERGGE